MLSEQSSLRAIQIEENEESKSWRGTRAVVMGAILVLALVASAGVWQRGSFGTTTSSSSALPRANALASAGMKQAKSDQEFPSQATPTPTICPYAFRRISPTSEEALDFAHCGMKGLAKDQHMVYTFGKVFMAARRTLADGTQDAREAVIILKQKMVLPQPLDPVPLAVYMEMTKQDGHCALKSVVGMYEGAPTNETFGSPHPPMHPANPAHWQEVPSPKHILVEAREAAKFAASKMTSCPFVDFSSPQYQIQDGYRFHFTVNVRNPSGKIVPCIAEVHASVSSVYTFIKGSCVSGEGC